MRDIYLIDFENVASEGLSGITYLSEDDQVIIFYSNNSNRLTMKMHILIGKSVCKLDYFEVTVGGKNALDHQISTWLGYLVGTGAAERNYYIVSRDMGYKHVANFWAANGNAPRVRCVDTIKAASRLERNRREAKEPILQAVPVEQPAAEPEVIPVPEEKPEEVIQIAVAETPVLEPVAAEPVEAEAETMIVPETEVTAEPAPEEPVKATQEPEAEAEAASRKNYRSRTRVRRNRSRSHTQLQENEKENAPTVSEAEAPEAVVVKMEAAVTEKESVSKQESAPKQEQKKPASHKKPQTREKAPESAQSGNPDQLSVLIAPYPKLQESVLRDLIANNKRQILCNTLRKHLGQEKGLALYNEIKRTAWH